jgi:hypothetical protein
MKLIKLNLFPGTKFVFTLIAMLVWAGSFAQDEQKTRFEIAGNVMTDMGYNFNQINPNYYDVMRPSQLPAYKNEYGADGTSYYGVRQSYFGLNIFTPTRYGELTINFSFDLFGVGSNTGQTAFHLLYAYAELGMLGVGRNWSLFSDIDGYPNTIEYWGPSGLSLARKIQIRFIPLKGENHLAFALEQPGASADEGIYRDRIELSDVEPKFDLPDFTAEFRMTRNWGYVEIAGVIRKIEWVDKGEEPYDLSGKALGWGLNFSTNLKISPKNELIGQTVFGKGIQNLMNDAPTDIGIQNNFDDANQPIKGVALPLVSYSLYLNHQWNQKFTSIAGYSAVYTNNSDGQNPDAFRNGQYASTNLLYYPTKNMTAGIELQWIKRKNFSDGWETSATKIQLSFRYSFMHIF